ncbi:MAG: hypothetical protein J5950_05395 [Clostridia bacterium]|nr:hypothetical protein [Clostridia bacterium]
MYFSEHNKKVVYINHYSGLLEVEGEGRLCKEDTVVFPGSDKDWKKDYNTLSITEGITGIGEGFLEAFPRISCLILSHTVTSIESSEALDKQLKKKKVLIRGEYYSFAEEFAKEKGLKFLHCDIPLGVYTIEQAHETDHLTLRFFTRGVPDIHFNCFTPGSSAGSYGGGEYTKDLPRDFYVDCTVEDIAESLSERVRDQILENDMLKRFLENANRRYKEKKRSKAGAKGGTKDE